MRTMVNLAAEAQTPCPDCGSTDIARNPAPSTRGHGEERITSTCAGCGADRGEHTIKTKGRPKRKDPLIYPKGETVAAKEDYTLFGVNGGYETRCTHPGCRHHYKSSDEAEAIERIENHARTHKMASANPTIEQASRALMSRDYDKLLGELTGGFGNTAVFGGCRVAAEALKQIFGGEIYALIADRDIKDPTYVPMVQHYVVKVGGGYIDARGHVTEHQLTNDDDFYFADKLVPATSKIIEYNRNIWSSPDAVRKTVDFIKAHS